MTVGENIRRLRIEAGLSQTELARMIGKTRSMISQYESDMYAPRMGTVEKLAAALRCTKSEIVDDRTVEYIYVDIAPEERELLSVFRQLDSRDRAALLQLAHTLSGGSAVGSEEGVA